MCFTECFDSWRDTALTESCDKGGENILLKPRLHSRGIRAGCTRLDDPCTTCSTTLSRPGTSVPGRERPWATAWRFSTGSEILSWGKNQSRFLLSGARTCLFVSWRSWLWHKRDKSSYNRDRAGEKCLLLRPVVVGLRPVVIGLEAVLCRRDMLTAGLKTFLRRF